MSTQIAIGFSRLSDPVAAFKEAAIQVKHQLNAIYVEVAVVFATDAYTSAAGLETLHRILQPTHLIGSLTPGIIFADKIEMRGVGIMGIISDEWHFGAASIDKLNQIPLRDAGYNLAQLLLSDHPMPNRNACLYFYDGLRKNGTLMCAGLRDGLGLAMPIVGGIGMDGPQIKHTRHFYQTRILDDAAVALLIGGASVTAIASRQSWKPLGKPRILTEVHGHIIRTIDNQPAASLYENYFLKEGTTLDQGRIHDIRLLYPLGIGTQQPREYLIRNPIDILEDGSIVCQGDIPTGSPVHLMVTDKDDCRQSLYNAALDLREQLFGKQPKFVIVLESFIRRNAMGHSGPQTMNIIRETLGASVPVFGMYTLGEIAPPGSLKNVHATQLLNASLVLLAIG